ncbi:MAG: hypothetical protein PHF84_04885, partial [bacterium]|nr:hypothetical protein [bacterium]
MKKNILVVLRCGIGSFAGFRHQFLNLLKTARDYNFYFFLPKDRSFFFDDKVPSRFIYTYDFNILDQYDSAGLKKYFTEGYPDLFNKDFFIGLNCGGEILNIYSMNKVSRITLSQFLVSTFCPAFIDFDTSVYYDSNDPESIKQYTIEFSRERDQNRIRSEYRKFQSLLKKNQRSGITRESNFDFSGFNLSSIFLDFVKQITKNKKLIALNPFTSTILKDYPLRKFLALRERLLKNDYKVILIGQTGDVVSPDYQMLRGDNYLPAGYNSSLSFVFQYFKSVLPKKHGDFTLKNIIIKYSSYSDLRPLHFYVVYEK